MLEDNEIIEQVEQTLKNEGVVEENPQKELSAFEQEQLAKGWNPEGVKSAEEWARSEPLYGEIKMRGKEIKQLRRTIDELKEHMDKQKEAAYKQALMDLQSQRRQAISEGNADLVDQIDEQTKELHMIQPTVEPPAVTEFKERNADWIMDSSYEAMEIQDFMFKRDQQLAARNLDPEEHIRILEEHIKKKFPNYFKQNEVEYVSKGNAVESSVANNATSSRKKSFEFKDLSAEQKQIARDFEKMGVMKVDEYIKQLVSNGDLQ